LGSFLIGFYQQVKFAWVEAIFALNTNHGKLARFDERLHLVERQGEVSIDFAPGHQPLCPDPRLRCDTGLAKSWVPVKFMWDMVSVDVALKGIAHAALRPGLVLRATSQSASTRGSNL
jgi:hypothetical protein